MSRTESRASTSVIFLCLIMTCIVLAIGGIAIGIFYKMAIEEHKARLSHLVQSAATAIEFIAEAEEPQEIVIKTRNRIQESQVVFPYAWLSEAGELRIGNAGGEEVTLLAGVSHPQMAEQQDERLRAKQLSEPMRRALANESGIYIGQDRHGTDVIAAYEPLPELGLGVVAKVDLAEIRAPFFKAGSIVAGSAVMMIAIGACLFFLSVNPIMARSREGDTRFRELFDSMRSGAVVVEAGFEGRKFVLKHLNRAAARMDGLKREDVLGQRVEDALPVSSKHGLLTAISRVWRSGQPEHLSMSSGKKDQDAVQRKHYIYRLSSGEVLILYDDISDQKRVEKVLRDNEAIWRSTIGMQSVATLIVDKDNYIRFVNHAAETLFGHPSGKLVGAPFDFPVAGSDVTEIEITRPNGSVVYAEMQSIPMPWGGKQQFLLFIKDVSAHRRTEGDLRKLFQAIEQSPVSVIITDLQGRIEYVNPKFTEATGYTYSEVVGKNPAILKSGYMSAAEYSALWKSIGSGLVWRGEFHNRKKSGDLFWEMASIAPVRDVHGKVTHYVCVKEDITERKATEDRLRQAHKLHAIGELTGGIAHDFNNMLAIILGNLQLLEEEMADDDEKRELISDAMWSAERGAELIDRLLAFAKRQRLNPKVTDLNHVVREMTDLLRRTLGEDIEIREVLAPTLVKTMIDRGQLQNALLNLTVNARDSMPEGGVLTIISENARLAADEIGDKHGAKPGEYAVISVTDTGTGMPADVVERIFEPFFTTKGFGKGSGLGLSMVYGFVSQSGGHVTVDSKVGRGTTIKLFLPKADPKDVGKDIPADREQGAGDAKVVMVVEADNKLRNTAVKALRKQGYNVMEARSAVEALSRLDGLQQLDLLLANVDLLGGMNGQELAQEVCRQRPQTRLLFVSDDPQKVVPKKGLPAGTLELLASPYPGHALVRKVREVFNRPSDGTAN
jgi:two-component system, cell cycle sensor histidine kinase and response regulator CckA